VRHIKAITRTRRHITRAKRRLLIKCGRILSDMRRYLSVGAQGERAAVQYLKNRNFIILERNWRFGRGELDIIAQDGRALVIVEVKTRRVGLSRDFSPAEGITPEKGEMLRYLTDRYRFHNRRHIKEWRITKTRIDGIYIRYHSRFVCFIANLQIEHAHQIVPASPRF
jgi:putative endonuclease